MKFLWQVKKRFWLLLGFIAVIALNSCGKAELFKPSPDESQAPEDQWPELSKDMDLSVEFGEKQTQFNFGELYRAKYLPHSWPPSMPLDSVGDSILVIHLAQSVSYKKDVKSIEYLNKRTASSSFESISSSENEESLSSSSSSEFEIEDHSYISYPCAADSAEADSMIQQMRLFSDFEFDSKDDFLVDKKFYQYSKTDTSGYKIKLRVDRCSYLDRSQNGFSEFEADGYYNGELSGFKEFCAYFWQIGGFGVAGQVLSFFEESHSDSIIFRAFINAPTYTDYYYKVKEMRCSTAKDKPEFLITHVDSVYSERYK